MAEDNAAAVGDDELRQRDRVIGPLRESRRSRHEGLALLRAAASALIAPEAPGVEDQLSRAVRFVEDVVLPSCRAEEVTLYIAVEGAIGAPGACDVMRAQHATIAAMASDLAKVAEAARGSGDAAFYRSYLLPLLYGMYALVRAHLEAEDSAYLPLLDERLSESQVGMIVDNTRRIAGGSSPPEQGIRFPQL